MQEKERFETNKEPEKKELKKKKGEGGELQLVIK